MKLEITQEELAEMSEETPIILAYRKAYEIRYSKGARRWVLVPLLEWHGDLPLTKRGRFVHVTASFFEKHYLNI